MNSKSGKFSSKSTKSIRKINDPNTNGDIRDTTFMKELVQTGRANWKKAPKAIKARYDGIFLVLLSIPVMLITSYELFNRLEGNSTKKVQQGELLEGQVVRVFDETEKSNREKNSIMYKIFGRDFFQDGITSKTINKGANKESNDR